MNKNETLKKIQSLKKKPFKKVFLQASLNDNNFKLFLLTKAVSDNYSMMVRLGKWRRKNQQWFLSQFPVSSERTKKWFLNNVIKTPDRILFIIFINKTYVGHVGLFRFNFKNKTTEIDNVVRGEKGYKGIMQISIEELMKWGEKELKIKNYNLKVLSDNTRAVQLYKRIGFKTIGKIPLYYEDSKTDGKILVEGTKGKKVKEYLVMKFIQK